MIKGIAIFGPNGAGKSTLAHALAKQTGYYEMDVEDLYFPEQTESRLHALENNGGIYIEDFEDLPFSNPRTRGEVQSAILERIKVHPKFVLSGVTMNWSDDILSHIDIAFWVQTPLEDRLKRIQTREENRFGVRVLEGGDMFAQQMEFRKVVENRDLNAIEECAKRFDCPVIVLDGTLPLAQNLERVLVNLLKIQTEINYEHIKP